MLRSAMFLIGDFRGRKPNDKNCTAGPGKKVPVHIKLGYINRISHLPGNIDPRTHSHNCFKSIEVGKVACGAIYRRWRESLKKFSPEAQFTKTKLTPAFSEGKLEEA